MCTYNRADFIKEAVDSVLAQTYTDWELLILDDASTDDTERVLLPYLADPRIRYIKNDHNLGITKNRNKALALANGEYIAVLDSDDYWVNTGKLAEQVEFLDSHPDYAVVGTNIIIISKKNNSYRPFPYPWSNFLIQHSLLFKNQFCHSAVVYRKNAIIELGSYDENLPIWEEYDLWLRVGQRYKLKNLCMYGTAYRLHNDQISSQRIKIGKDTQIHLIEKYRRSYHGYTIALLLNKLRNFIRKCVNR
jgi:glycosyltransferase involved in cell wall biosynthesis